MRASGRGLNDSPRCRIIYRGQYTDFLNAPARPKAMVLGSSVYCPRAYCAGGLQVLVGVIVQSISPEQRQMPHRPTAGPSAGAAASVRPLQQILRLPRTPPKSPHSPKLPEAQCVSVHPIVATDAPPHLTNAIPSPFRPASRALGLARHSAQSRADDLHAADTNETSPATGVHATPLAG